MSTRLPLPEEPREGWAHGCRSLRSPARDERGVSKGAPPSWLAPLAPQGANAHSLLPARGARDCRSPEEPREGRAGRLEGRAPFVARSARTTGNECALTAPRGTSDRLQLPEKPARAGHATAAP
ncbi:hypothetical protein GCM10028771_22660 [Nocardioides marmoraquaticus]